MTTHVHDTPGSSNINQVAYDDEKQELEIAFGSGHIYVYSNVPQEVFEGFKQGGSVGSYFSRNVRGRYADRKK